MRSLSALPAALLAGLALVSTGCLNGPVNAPQGSGVSLSPSELMYTVTSATCFADNDGTLHAVDAFVVGPDGLPLPHTKVEAFSGFQGGVILLPTTAVRTVDYPTAPADFEAQKSEVCINDAGQYDPDGASWCAWYYDRTTGTFYDFGADYADASGQDDTSNYHFAPDYVSVETDRRGIARFYFFIDALPFSISESSSDTAGAVGTSCGGIGDFSGASLYATIGVDYANYDIQVDGGT